MKTRKILAMGLLLLLACATACKPTEKNYRQAYEAAKGKREQKDPDEALLTGGHKLLSEESTAWKRIGQDTLQLQHVMVRPAEGYSWPQSGPYRLAVAMFKMSTNANAAIKDIKGEDLKPVIAKTGTGKLYLIAGSATYPDSLAMVLDAFRKANPGFRSIGLEGEKPLVVVSR